MQLIYREKFWDFIYEFETSNLESKQIHK